MEEKCWISTNSEEIKLAQSLEKNGQGIQAKRILSNHIHTKSKHTDTR